MDLSGQPDRFETLLRQELDTGERLLWHARGIARSKRGSLALVLFAIPWTAFAVFWTTMAFTMTRGSGQVDSLFAWLFPAFGLPFIAVGLFMLAGPLLSRIAAGRTAYAITDQRVIQLMAGKSVMSQSVPLSKVEGITRHERANGNGTLKLDLQSVIAGPYSARKTGFELGEVPQVRLAEQALRQAMERAAAQASRAG